MALKAHIKKNPKNFVHRSTSEIGNDLQQPIKSATMKYQIPNQKLNLKIIRATFHV